MNKIYVRALAAAVFSAMVVLQSGCGAGPAASAGHETDGAETDRIEADGAETDRIEADGTGTDRIETDGTKKPAEQFDDYDDPAADRIAAVYRDIYAEAARTDTLGSLEVTRRIIARLGENGYTAVDSDNQVDMAGSGQAEAFCKAVEEKKNGGLTVIELVGTGFRKYDLETEGGNVNITRGYYQYDQNGRLQNRNTASYPADLWQYTQEGYLLFEGRYFSDENYALTLSEAAEHTALRVQPLDEKCREQNRKYILPVGYGHNNVFLCDWSEDDYGELDFYDLFDRLYPMVYGQPHPYTADENLGVGTVYRIPADLFENVIMTYLHIDRETLRSKTKYIPACAAYEYRPRGFYEAEYPDLPYPEVVSCTENRNGTVTLTINAVYPNGNTSKLYAHRTVIRPSDGGGFQYVSNQMITSGAKDDMWWHCGRLTQEQWEEVYGREAD